jgi:MoxR-like ATPase
MTRSPWYVVDDTRRPIDPGGRAAWLADFPPWRGPGCMAPTVDRRAPDPGRQAGRGERHRITGGKAQLDAINAALRLRRPLLVTGAPGVGKSSLAWWLAWKLDLGRVLAWSVTPSSTLAEGLYRCDGPEEARPARASRDWGDRFAEPGRQVRLGPLGTALLPTPAPRVLLVDDLDQGSADLALSLLRVLEDGSFDIKELARAEGTELVAPHDAAFADDLVPVPQGRVVAFHPPVVVVTAADAAALPELLVRRCVRLQLGRPDDETLAEIAAEWLGERTPEARLLQSALVELDPLSTDAVLQALYLLGRGAGAAEAAALLGDGG